MKYECKNAALGHGIFPFAKSDREHALIDTV